MARKGGRAQHPWRLLCLLPAESGGLWVSQKGILSGPERKGKILILAIKVDVRVALRRASTLLFDARRAWTRDARGTRARALSQQTSATPTSAPLGV